MPLKTFASALLVSLLPLAATGFAQEPASQEPPGDEQDITLELAPERMITRVRLALPEMDYDPDMSADARRAAEELEQALLQDLAYSDIFDVQDQEILSVLELTGDRAQDFPMYRSLGNQVILLGEVSQSGGRLVLETRVLDLQNFRTVCQSKRYRGTLGQARRIAHTYADEVVACFSGERGISLTSIVFASNRTGHKEIYIMDYDGHDQRPLSGHQSICLAPAWSPAGDGLAYVSYFSGFPSIYWVELATGEKVPIIEDGHHNFSPSFAPDGRRMAFTRSVSGNAEIYTIDRGSGDLRQLTNHGRIDANPAWSPDGREIAFTSDRSGTPQIYLMDADGGNVRRLTRSGANNDGATWHPEGRRIAYAHRHQSGNRYDIALVDLVTLELNILTTGPGTHEAPSFSPDGRRIAFESTRDGTQQIWVVDVDGGNLRRLTSEGANFAPAWSTRPE